MKHTFTLVLFSVFILSWHSCNEKHNVVLNISGLGDDTVFVRYVPISQYYSSEWTIDTVYSKQNVFYFDSKITEPVLVEFSPAKGRFKLPDGSLFSVPQKEVVLLIKPNDNIKVKGNLEANYLDYEAFGSEYNEIYGQIRFNQKDTIIKLSKILQEFNFIRLDTAKKHVSDSLISEIDKMDSILEIDRLDYVKNNPDKELSAYYLVSQGYDTIEKYYPKLTPDIREGTFKNMLDYHYQHILRFNLTVENEKKVSSGTLAPEFVLTSLSGSDFSLDSIKDKYIVLDFWGSWCGWCIKGFPEMKEYYRKYKNKLEIVGIACHDKEDAWRRSVEENGLEWIQLINKSDIEHNVSILYGVRGYPSKIILDKNKRIVARFLGETPEFYTKLDELLR
ncbi:TlpA family protein disulfide reductase [Saccharicrinis sp. FJH54]|uniref:TlpA family protein disulfide reductase n=1 Tax=Saccharicrinis sp. FJH54 TaxID=3344665 RepID=UPI0035D3E7E2